MEDVFGSVLLERGKQGASLTMDGRRLLDRAGKLVELNDVIWNEFAAPEISGQVRIGIPYDLVGTHLPPTMRNYARNYPSVDISIISGSSTELVRALSKGKLDLALVEEPLGETGGECLAVEQLVWVGQRAGNAYRKRPLPLCLVSETCVFRPAIFTALESKGIDWRIVFDNASIEATNATVRTDLAVTAWLASTVPADLEILGLDSGLPSLPKYAISLYLPKRVRSAASNAMAATIRSAYAERPMLR